MKALKTISLVAAAWGALAFPALAAHGGGGGGHGGGRGGFGGARGGFGGARMGGFGGVRGGGFGVRGGGFGRPVAVGDRFGGGFHGRGFNHGFNRGDGFRHGGDFHHGHRRFRNSNVVFFGGGFPYYYPGYYGPGYDSGYYPDYGYYDNAGYYDPGYTAYVEPRVVRVTTVTVPASTVVDVQSELKQLGYYAGAIDGIAGPQTRAAIRAYQRHVGFARTGRIDRSLLKMLRLA